MTIEPAIIGCMNIWIEEIRKILGERLLSVYLYGSAAMQDYRDGWSDIDCLCLTAEPLLMSEAENLLLLRQHLTEREQNPLFRKIEGILVFADEFLQNQYTNLVYWGTGGQRITDSYQFDVFSRASLLQCGVLLCGTELRDRLTPPSCADLVSGVRQHYETIRKYAAQTGESLYSCGWLLDIARCLYTLRYHAIISKTEAGRWALREHLCPCEEALQRTLTLRMHPAAYREVPEIRSWLCTLGPSIQKFADVLAGELEHRIGLEQSDKIACYSRQNICLHFLHDLL